MRAHIITAATAASLGLTAGLVAGGAPEVAAKSLTQSQWSQIDPLPAAAKTALENFILTRLCPKNETDAGLDPGDCTVADIKKVVLVPYQDDGDVRQWRVSFQGSYDGTWTKGTPP